MTTNKIPSVNLADFLSANVDKKNEFVQSIGRAFKNAMYLMASQFNKATQTLSLVDQFQETKNKYLK